MAGNAGHQAETGATSAVAPATAHIGIVVPAFGHPQFLAEAIESAATQDFPGRVTIVVVDDGCRFPETASVVSGLMAAHPGRLHYLRQKNARLPSARNTGVRFLLQLDAALDAVFFLDADNRLESWALGAYWTALGDDPTTGWAYPDIAFFGLTWGLDGVEIRETAPQYSVLKHFVGNIAEAGSLVRADVFRGGTWFDETMNFGFEDWDFWLSALEAGFTGTRAKNCGFLYRRRPESMLIDSRRMEGTLLATLADKHAALYDHDYLMRLEHEEAPPYAILIVDRDEVILTGDPLATGHTVSLERFAAMARDWLRSHGEFFFPEKLLFLTESTWQALTETPVMLRYLFWHLRHYERPLALLNLAFDAPFAVAESADDGASPVVAALVAKQHLTRLLNAGDGLAGVLQSGLQRWHCDLPLKHAGTGVDATDRDRLFQGIRDLVAATGPEPRWFRHLTRRFEGPREPLVRAMIMDRWCANTDARPFPISRLQAPRLVVALPDRCIVDPTARTALIPLLERLSAQGFSLMLVIEQAASRPVGPEHLAPLLPFCDELAWLTAGTGVANYRAYLGHRLPICADARSLGLAAALAKAGDGILSVGDTAIVQAFGLAREVGIPGYLYLDPALTGESQALDRAIGVTLAYEHAEKAVIAEPSAVKAALTAEGYPPSKIIDLDAACRQIVAIARSKRDKEIRR